MKNKTLLYGYDVSDINLDSFKVLMEAIQNESRGFVNDVYESQNKYEKIGQVIYCFLSRDQIAFTSVLLSLSSVSLWVADYYLSVTTLKELKDLSDSSDNVFHKLPFLIVQNSNNKLYLLGVDITDMNYNDFETVLDVATMKRFGKNIVPNSKYELLGIKVAESEEVFSNLDRVALIIDDFVFEEKTIKDLVSLFNSGNANVYTKIPLIVVNNSGDIQLTSEKAEESKIMFYGVDYSDITYHDIEQSVDVAQMIKAGKSVETYDVDKYDLLAFLATKDDIVFENLFSIMETCESYFWGSTTLDEIKELSEKGGDVYSRMLLAAAENTEEISL